MDQNFDFLKYSSNLRRNLNSIDNFLIFGEIDEQKACQLYKNITDQYSLISDTSTNISKLIEEASTLDFNIKKTSLPVTLFQDLTKKLAPAAKVESYNNCEYIAELVDNMENKFNKSKEKFSKKKIYFDNYKKKKDEEDGSEEDDFGGDFKKKSNYMKKLYRQAAYQSFKKFKNGRRDYSSSSSDEAENEASKHKMFTTAKKQLISENKNSIDSNKALNNKSLGARRGPGSKFVPPTSNRDSNMDNVTSACTNSVLKPLNKINNENCVTPAEQKLKNIEPRIVELIMSEIMDRGPKITWDDIAGLEFVKKTIKEIVVWPMLRPDIFTGLRRPPKGLLLFGPPGTGKTLIGKCIASQSNSTFFSISASSLTSKWVGEGEKMVRALFTIARLNEPAVIFIDEIDSLLSQRSESEHESSRRIKTEFLVQLDGTFTGDSEKLLVVGATNRPHDLDEAARRRFVKRLYIPLPETSARKQIIQLLLKDQQFSLAEDEMTHICQITDGYSGADVANLCREAALGPIRRLNFSEIQDISSDQVSDIVLDDFLNGSKQVRASCSPSELIYYIEWNTKFGSCDLA